MVCAGIDGSKGGWISVIRRAKKLEVFHARRISQIFQLHHDIDLALVDIPVGIGSQNASREVEQLARNQLRPYRHASVFNPPVREVTATLGGKWGLDRLQPTPTCDEYGIEMNMHYFNPARVYSLP